MIRFILVSSNLLFLLALPGCSLVQGLFSWVGPPDKGISNASMQESMLSRLAPDVRAAFDRLLPAAQSGWIQAHSTVDAVVAKYKRSLTVAALKQPWEGLSDVERQGLLLAELAEGRAVNLPVILDVLEAGMDRTSAFHKPVAVPKQLTIKDMVDFMLESLEEASIHREKAVSNLTDDERRFMFTHAKSLAEQFTPQISSLSIQASTRAQADQRFAGLLEEQVDYANLIAAAQVLARLANDPWARQLVTVFGHAAPVTKIPAGITGTVLYVEETPYGLIVIGGIGQNTYELDQRFGLVIDLGGDDVYGGMIAASVDADHGNAVVIDLSGNDTYNGSPLGLATGRLGVGLLIDQAGDDVYQLGTGSGGAGFGGLGILFDARGNDVYMGSRLTQGAAIGGLGLLFDASGNDRYTSHGFSVGFGGPQGVGAVIDLQGEDQYQCGNKFPSAYNAEDAPAAKPGDSLFQYDCFGLGTGAGKRILTKRPDWQGYNLAGGWGLLLDMEGNDRYQSANFSQGHGYFFGAGLFLDLDGNDEYLAARYGHGSSAHYGVGLFNDRHGADRYASTGPFYNGGVAWDHGVSLMIDAGFEADRYDLSSTTGLGKGDYSGWGLFIDEGGDDQYHAKEGFGRSSEHGLGAFFDLKGHDTYDVLPDAVRRAEDRPSDGKVTLYPEGGLFVDR
ncbi:MAG TPA: hypothetical protein VH332_08515 [Nitrospira sp.]